MIMVLLPFVCEVLSDYRFGPQNGKHRRRPGGAGLRYLCVVPRSRAGHRTLADRVAGAAQIDKTALNW
jgi:hypothetical protein